MAAALTRATVSCSDASTASRSLSDDGNALDAAAGDKLWGQDLGGAIAGGVITYTASAAQKVARASGFTMLAWPTKIVTAEIAILGLEGASANQ